MKIVILGSGGMLGKALIRRFSRESKFEVLGLDHEQLDITDRDQVFSLLSDLHPEIIFNAAAYTAVDDAQKNRDTAFDVNARAVEYIADFCSAQGVKLVHFSTDYVFDGEKEHGYEESDTPGKPLNVYGTSKLEGEEALKGQFYLIRTSWLFGLEGKNFVKTMLQLAETKPELSIVNDQIGNPTFVEDLADATFRLVTESHEPGIYHLVNEGSVSWYEFAKEIFELSSGKKPALHPVSSGEFPRPAARPHISILKNTKFPKLRGHKEALQEYLKSEVQS